MDPATNPTSSTDSTAPAATDPTPGDAVVDPAAEAPAEGAAGAPVAVDPLAVTEPAVAGGPPATDPPAATKPRVDLTARLAKLSREKREREQAAKRAERELGEAKARLTSLDEKIAKAKSDPAALRQLLADNGLDFSSIVNAYAEAPDPTPDQAREKALEDVRKEVAELKKLRDDEATQAKARAAQAAEAEMLASVAQSIGKQADKYELCARNGDEAARDVLAKVTATWEKAGRPQLMPGELEDAIQAAIGILEIEYEERGKKYSKQPKSATAPAAGAPAANGSKVHPALQVTGKLSETDEDILKGLIDKSAPLASSQRAKPQTIGSSLGGSAPPRAPNRGDMDPREALRAILAQQ